MNINPENNEENEDILTENRHFLSNFDFNDTLLISEKFYRHKKLKHDKYSARAKTTSFYKPIDRSSKALDEMKEMVIQNLPSKYLERQRKSIYLR